MNWNGSDKVGGGDHAATKVTLMLVVPVRKVSLHADLDHPTNNGVRIIMAIGEIVDMILDVNHAKPRITVTLLLLDLFLNTIGMRIETSSYCQTKLQRTSIALPFLYRQNSDLYPPTRLKT